MAKRKRKKQAIVKQLLSQLEKLNSRIEKGSIVACLEKQDLIKSSPILRKLLDEEKMNKIAAQAAQKDPQTSRGWKPDVFSNWWPYRK